MAAVAHTLPSDSRTRTLLMFPNGTSMLSSTLLIIYTMRSMVKYFKR